jgi:predicted O-methyltransferase YrrM
MKERSWLKDLERGGGVLSRIGTLIVVDNVVREGAVVI